MSEHQGINGLDQVITARGRDDGGNDLRLTDVVRPSQQGKNEGVDIRQADDE